MHHYLERLEEQQKLVLELITGKKQALLEHMQSKDSLRNTKQVRTYLLWKSVPSRGGITQMM